MLGIPDVGYSGCWVFETFGASIPNVLIGVSTRVPQ